MTMMFMDYSSWLPQTLLLQSILLAVSLLIFHHLFRTRRRSSYSSKSHTSIIYPPKAAGALPVIGHLYTLFRGLAAGVPLYRQLDSMANRYGPAFIIHLGVHPTLVVTCRELAKECFTTNDQTFATRPSTSAGKYIGYNYAFFGFAPYGPYWREARKIATVELLSNYRLDSLRHVREAEVARNVDELYALHASSSTNKQNMMKIDMKQWFDQVTLNVILMMVVGKRCVTTGGDEEEVRVVKVLHEFFKHLGTLSVSDVVPYVEWMDLDGNIGRMKRTAKELDCILGKWLEEHRRERRSDFMDALLDMVQGIKIPYYDCDTVIKAICLNLLNAGSDTLGITMTWALSLLLNNRHVLKKVKDELDVHVGKNRQVEELDIKNLVYLHAVVKETLRLFPPAPLGVPHEAMEDCVVGGFHVAKGTRLLVNVWKLQRDPSVWSDPLAFKPERFLDNNTVDLRGQHFQFLPFGSGRRGCPGVTFALQVAHLTLARLLHGFEWDTPDGAPVDMSEVSVLTTVKKNPVEVLFTPRLPPEVYTQKIEN